MHGLREISADKSTLDINLAVRNIRQDKSRQFVKSRVDGGGVIGENNGFSVRAAFNFPVLRKNKTRRTAGNKYKYGDKECQDKFTGG
jgi:hypothetical protein